MRLTFSFYTNFIGKSNDYIFRSLIGAFDEEDGDAAKEAIESKAIKNLDIDFARLAKQIKLPDSDAFNAAAAKLGEERNKVVEQEKKAARDAKRAAGESSAMEPEQVVEEQKKLEESDEDDLC